jgi:hypothetical protein
VPKPVARCVSWWFVDTGHDLAVVIRMLYLAIVQVFGWLALLARVSSPMTSARARRRGEDCGVARSATRGSSLAPPDRQTRSIVAGSGCTVRADQAAAPVGARAPPRHPGHSVVMASPTRPAPLDVVPAGNLIRAGQAACSYSWRMPPSRSRRRTRSWAISCGSAIGVGSGRRGRALSRP